MAKQAPLRVAEKENAKTTKNRMLVRVLQPTTETVCTDFELTLASRWTNARV